MGDHSFARLIKRRRDALGFSQARLGELVGRSASTIRNWERGNSTPSERSDAVALAAVLGLDERDVLEGAGFDVEAAGTHQTLEQGYASLAPERHSVPEVAAEEEPAPEVSAENAAFEQATVDEVSVVEERPDTGAPSQDEGIEIDHGSVPAPGHDRGEESAGVETGSPVEAARAESKPTRPDRPNATDEETAAAEADLIPSWPPPEPDEAQVDDRPGSEPRPVWAPGDRAATSPPAESPPASRRLARAAPPTVLEATPPGEPSYLEDPGERQQYRIRAVVTAALVIGLVIVLLWAFDRATDAFSTLWDDFFSQLRV